MPPIHVMRLVKPAGVRLQAESVANECSRTAYVTRKFSGLREVESNSAAKRASKKHTYLRR